MVHVGCDGLSYSDPYCHIVSKYVAFDCFISFIISTVFFSSLACIIVCASVDVFGKLC